ncbi:hypothetical protein F5Y05DRAFT_395469 [Hypoxylon sp. FL0543]|nr:hypothetical protein F5Y05DRAFT_395469 [Hypoxylon sp. FL0543]
MQMAAITMAAIQRMIHTGSRAISMATAQDRHQTECILVMNTLSYWAGHSFTGTKGYETNIPTSSAATMSARQRIRDIIDTTRDHISNMSGRYRITPADFDQLYQLYQEDTSAKGLYEFIVDHHITHSIAGRLNVRPIDVLATMVNKSVDTCQQELDAEIAMYQAAEKKAAEARAKAKAEDEKKKACKPESEAEEEVKEEKVPKRNGEL